MDAKHENTQVVTRDEFVIQPMPDLVIAKIIELATRQGYVRGEDPTLEIPEVIDEGVDDSLPPDIMHDGDRRSDR